MNNQERFEAILIECLAAMETGERIEQLVARYPAYAARLDAALRVAARLTASGSETLRAMPSAQESARAAFLDRAASTLLVSPRSLRVWRLVRPLVSFLAAVALLVAIGGGVLGVSAASLPGDPLYGIKRSFEGIQLSLARDPVQRVTLEENYGQRRMEEVKAMQASKRAASVEFVAPIEVMNVGEWTVGGFSVQVISSTLIGSELQPGDWVEITGRTLPDGQIIADRVEEEGGEFVGVVEAMNAQTWVIGGQRLLVTSATRITGPARPGAQAEVHVRMFPDGTRLALKIEFQDHDALPLLQPTPTPRPTQIPIATPQATDTLERERNSVTPEAGGPRDDDATPEPEPSEHHDKEMPEPTESHDEHTPEPRHGGD